MRLPLLIVSAYAKQGFVSHIHYEHGSILRFTEDQFDLPRLNGPATGGRIPLLPPESRRIRLFAAAAQDSSKIHAPYDENFFLHQPLDSHVPDSD